MPYKLIIGGDSTITLGKCIESIQFKVDTPNDSNARNADIDHMVEIRGRIGTEEATVDLYHWSTLPPSNDTKAKIYRNVEVHVIGALGSMMRKVIFPDCFVVDYYESFSSLDGNGSFYLLLKQKKDKNGKVEVKGDMEVGDEDAKD